MQNRTIALAVAVVLAAHLPAAAAPVRDDFQISGPVAADMVYAPQLGASSHGTSLIAWMAGSGAHPAAFDITARMFGPGGLARDAVFAISPPQSTVQGAWRFALDMNDNGFFAVAHNTGPTDLRLYRFENDGTPAGSEYANLIDHQANMPHPDIAINNVGYVFPVWDEFNDVSNTWSVVANAWPSTSPAPYATAVVIDSAGEYPEVAMSANGRMMIVYISGGLGSVDDSLAGGVYTVGTQPTLVRAIPKRPHYGDAAYHTFDVAARPDNSFLLTYRDAGGIKLEAFGNDGISLGAQVPVSGPIPSSTNLYGQRIAAGSDGRFAITWFVTENRGQLDERDVGYVRTFTANGVPLAPAKALFEELHRLTGTELPSAILGADTLIVTCVDGFSVYQQYFDMLGDPLDVPLCVNALGTEAAYPSVAVSKTTGRSVSAWEWNTSGRIYVQFLDADGEMDSVNLRANTTGAGHGPAVGTDNATFVAWEDTRGVNDTSVYLQRYDADGRPTGTNLRVNASGATSIEPEVAVGNGKALVVWTNKTTGHVNGQWYTEAGVEQGGTFVVSTKTTIGSRPCAAAGGGGFVVVWNRMTAANPPITMGSSNVYAQRYDSDGNPAGDTIWVNTVRNGASTPRVDMDTAGNFVVAWIQGALVSGYHVYYQRYDMDGQELGSSVRVDSDAASKNYVDIGVANDGAFGIVWEAISDSAPVASRTFARDGTVMDSVTAHNNATIRTPFGAPVIAAGKQSMLTAWMNSHCEDVTQRDIWGELRELRDPSTAHVARPVQPAHADPARLSTAAMQEPRLYDLRGRLVAGPAHTFLGGVMQRGRCVLLVGDGYARTVVTP